MSYLTRRPGGGWSNIGSSGNYSYVVSNYAAALAQANVQQKQTDLENKVLDYKNGVLPFSDLQTYINGRISAAVPGSTEELNLRTSLSDLQDYDRTQQINIKRSTLEAKYAKDGISAAERLSIENELLPLFKAGTAEYTEQLNTIATANELSRQEAKNTKLAQISAKLSEGGLSTKEQIDYYKQARAMTDNGSEDQAKIDQKLAELKTQQVGEERDMKALAIQADFYDKNKDGGISTEEAIQLNRQLQSVYPEGSQENVQLKAKEAELLGTLADEAKAGSNKAQKAQNEADATQLAALEANMKLLSDKPQSPETLQQMMDITNQENALVGKNPDAATPSDKGELQSRMQQLQTLKNQVDTGQAVVVKGMSNVNGIPTASQQIVPLSELANHAQDYPVYSGFDAKGNPIESPDSKVVTIVDKDGQEKQVVIKADGSLQVLNSQEIKDPTSSDPNKKTTIYMQTGQILSYGNKAKMYSPIQSKPAEQMSSPVANVPAPTANANAGAISSPTTTAKKSSSNSSNSSSSKKPSVIADIKTTANKVSSAISPAISSVLNPTPGKVAGTKDYGVTEAIKKVTGISPVSAGKINIGGVNLPDYGVTEKIGSLLSSAKNKVSSLISNLFGKK